MCWWDYQRGVGLSSQGTPEHPAVGLRRGASTGTTGADLFLLSLWVAALTFNLDVLSEFKAYDFIGVLCIFRFRKSLLVALRRPRANARWLLWFFGFVLLGTLVTVLRSSTTTEILVVGLRFYRVFCAICLFLILGRSLRSLSQAFVVLHVIFLSALVQALLIVLQWMGIVPILWPEAERYYLTIYPTGTLGLNHLNSVLFMVVGLAAALAVFFRDEGWPAALRAPLFGVASVTMIAAMLAGESLSGLVALPTMGLSMSWRVKGARIVFIVVICAVLMRPFLATDLSGQAGRIWEDRITAKGVDLSGELEDIYQVDRIRSRLWFDTIAALLEHPVLLIVGTGFQNFRALGVSATGAHNQYLTALTELGIGGFVAFSLWLWSQLMSFRRNKKVTEARLTVPLMSAFSCIAALMVVGLFNSVLYPARALPGFFGFALAYFGVMGAALRVLGATQPFAPRVAFRKRHLLPTTPGNQI